MVKSWASVVSAVPERTTEANSASVAISHPTFTLLPRSGTARVQRITLSCSGSPLATPWVKSTRRLSSLSSTHPARPVETATAPIPSADALRKSRLVSLANVHPCHVRHLLFIVPGNRNRWTEKLDQRYEERVTRLRQGCGKFRQVHRKQTAVTKNGSRSSRFVSVNNVFG